MRCRTVRRLISDEIDGRPALPDGAGASKSTLPACPSCREYGERLWSSRRIVPGPEAPAVPPGYWEGSIARLDRKSQLGSAAEPSAGADRKPAPAVFPPLGMGGAAALVVAAAGLYFRAWPIDKSRPFPLSHEDAAGRLVAMIGNDEVLEADLTASSRPRSLENSEARTADAAAFSTGTADSWTACPRMSSGAWNRDLAKELKI